MDIHIEEEITTFEDDLIKSIDGILSGVDVDSVDLQHKIMGLLAF